MNNAVRWSALALPKSLFRPVRPKHSLHLTHRAICPATFQYSRALSTSQAFTKDSPSEQAKGPSQQAVKNEEQKTRTGTPLQKKVDDRPWHREEGSNFSLETTSPDPSGGDHSKGQQPYYRRKF